MKRTSVTTAAGSPSKGKSPAGGKKSAGKTADGSPSIPQPSSPPHVTRPDSSPVRQRLNSFVDDIADRLIDKLCRLELGPESLAVSPAKQPVLRVSDTARANHMPLIDLKHNSVVNITLTAKRPVPGLKTQLFRGTIHLNTNDILLSEDVDKLLAESPKKAARKDSPASHPRKGTGASAQGMAGNEEDSASGGLDDPHPSIRESAKSQSEADVATTEGPDVTTASSQSSGSHADGKEENVGSGEDQSPNSESPGSRTPPVRRDPRGRKVGSPITTTTLPSLESRLADRIKLKLKPVIISNGYDFAENQIVDQTEIARLTHGIELIAFQRVIMFCRSKTPEDLMYGVEKGVILDEPLTSSHLTLF